MHSQPVSKLSDIKNKHVEYFKKISCTFKRAGILLLFMLSASISQQAYPQQYFQQEVNHNIDVSLDDKEHRLRAFTSIEYTNNSPDTLHSIYLHLWPNAYSDNKTDLAKQIFSTRGKGKLFNDPELRGYMDSLDFRVGGNQVKWSLLPHQPDICLLTLNEPLQPGQKIVITTPFVVKLPKGVTSRLGHIGQSYQVSQWYPKPAVYDSKGWHPMPYLDMGEFYSEFGRFDVRITLPENYIVAASGDLQDKQELEMLEQLGADTLRTRALLRGKFPPSSGKLKTLRYTAENVHDFAWFADKRFHVLKDKVTLRSGKEVSTWILFTNRQSFLWRKALPYLNKAILDFSGWIGDYPYDNFTVVQSPLMAGLGMEYPGLAVVSQTKNAYTLERVIVHEASHNWFYGALGTNERRYPYLDEGLATAYEMRYMKKHYPGRKLWQEYLKKEKQARFFNIEHIDAERLPELEWLVAARQNLEQPVNASSTDITPMNYGLMVYNKAALSFNYLRAYLGDTVFDAAVRAYYQRWKFRHPQPEDLRQVFEKHAGKNLDWFFDDLMGTTKRLDYKMVRYQNGRLLVENAGELVSPLVIGGLGNDSVHFQKWVEGFKGRKWIDLPPGDYTQLKIDPDYVMPELYRINNNIRTSGIFPKADPVVPQLLLTLEDPEKHTIMYLPAINWNREDGFMLGLAVHNGFLIPKRVEYLVMPFYTFNNNNIAGYGKMSYNIMPYNSFIRLAKPSLEGSRFGAPGNYQYNKLKAGLDIYFRNNRPASSFIKSAYARYILASDFQAVLSAMPAQMNTYFQLGFNLQKATMVNPHSLRVSLESGPAYSKAGMEFNYRLSYPGRDNGLDMRLFAGSMLGSIPRSSFYGLAPAARSGRDLYLYEGNYLDRFGTFPSTLWSRQMTIQEGGLVSPVNEAIGYSNRLVSLSLSSGLPGWASRLGIRPFANAVLNDHGLDAAHPSHLFGEAGVKIGMWNFIEVHLPLLVTRNIESVAGSVGNRIRIVFNLNFSIPNRITTGI